MAGIIHLVNMDEHQLIIAGNHWQGGFHNGLIGSGILAGSVIRSIHSGLRNELLEPVIAGDGGTQAEAVNGGKNVILGKGGDIGIIQINGRSIARRQSEWWYSPAQSRKAAGCASWRWHSGCGVYLGKA